MLPYASGCSWINIRLALKSINRYAKHFSYGTGNRIYSREHLFTKLYSQYCTYRLRWMSHHTLKQVKGVRITEINLKLNEIQVTIDSMVYICTWVVHIALWMKCCRLLCPPEPLHFIWNLVFIPLRLRECWAVESKYRILFFLFFFYIFFFSFLPFCTISSLGFFSYTIIIIYIEYIELGEDSM